MEHPFFCESQTDSAKAPESARTSKKRGSGYPYMPYEALTEFSKFLKEPRRMSATQQPPKPAPVSLAATHPGANHAARAIASNSFDETL